MLQLSDGEEPIRVNVSLHFSNSAVVSRHFSDSSAAARFLRDS